MTWLFISAGDFISRYLRESSGANAQSPSAGQRVLEGTAVRLTVEAESVVIPDVRGRPVEQAESQIRQQRLMVRTSASGLDPDIQTPQVVGQDPAPGNRVKPGTTVTLHVANPGVRVPNLIGQHEKEATSLLGQVNLRAGYITRQSHEKYQFGFVMYQSPAAGQVVKPGSTVALTVSTGSPQTRVPNLIGRYEKEAMNLLMQANLRVGFVSRQESGRYQAGVVMQQSPAARQLVRPGSAVNFTVSEGIR